MRRLGAGYPEQVDLYSVCVGLALGTSLREQLADKDQLFADIAKGEGEQWNALVSRLLPDLRRADGGQLVMGRSVFSSLCQAIIHRLRSIGGWQSLKLEQQKAEYTRRALSAIMSPRSMTEQQELVVSLESTARSIAERATACKSGSPTPGAGEPTTGG